MVILVIGTSLRRCSSHHPTPLAHSQSYLWGELATPRMEDSRVEEAGPPAPTEVVTSGQMGPGPGQPTSRRADMVMSLGPLLRVCSSSEETSTP